MTQKIAAPNQISAEIVCVTTTVSPTSPEQVSGDSFVRQPIGKKLRFEIFKRDSFQCIYCGRVPPEILLEVDHITPVSKGGSNDESNLITSCKDCNIGKGNRSLKLLPVRKSNEAERQEKLEQLRAISEAEIEKKQVVEDSVEAVLGHWETMNTAEYELFITQSHKESIRHFLKNGLSPITIIKCLTIAAEKFSASDYRFFKYFCGVCWRTIKGDAHIYGIPAPIDRNVNHPVPNTGTTTGSCSQPKQA